MLCVTVHEMSLAEGHLANDVTRPKAWRSWKRHDVIWMNSEHSLAGYLACSYGLGFAHNEL